MLRALGALVLLVLLATHASAQAEPRFTYNGDRPPPQAADITVHDRFFDADFYVELYRGGPVKAELLGREGKPVSRAEVSQEALKRLKAAARAAKIAPEDITRAMLAGEFNPSLEDVKLAFEGLQPEGSLTRDDMPPDFLKTLERDGVMKVGEMPPESYLMGTYHGRRVQLWNASFGAVGEIDPVGTIVEGETVEASANDLALWMMQSRGRFTKTYGIEAVARRSLKKTLSVMGEGEAAKLLERDVARTLKRAHVLDLFVAHAVDFDALRSRYLKEMKEAHLAALKKGG